MNQPIETMTAVDEWCQQIPGLEKRAGRGWGSTTLAQVSFPVGEQSALAEIEENSYWFKHRNAAIVSIVRRYPPSGLIVDVGGGNGFVSKALLQQGFSALVVEPGPIAVEKCFERGVPAVLAAYQDLDVPHLSTQAVSVFDVLEHIEDDDAALANFYNILAPGGRLYVTVPAYQWLWSNEDVSAGHFRRYSCASLRRKLEKAGFSVEFESYMFASLVLPLFALRSLPTILGFRKVVEIDKIAKEHSLPSNLVGEIISRSLSKELSTLISGKAVSFGTSCLAVARRRRHLALSHAQ